MRRLSIALLGLLILGAKPCTSDRQSQRTATTGPTEMFSGSGVVHQGVGPECPTTWRIDSADGRMLWPVEKPEFQVEGLRVRFTAREREAASICMAGTIVEVITIEKE